MEDTIPLQQDIKLLIHELGKSFSERSEQYDLEESFVFENYKLLKKYQLFSIAIPQELGGGGYAHQEVCDMIRIIAQYCASTALAFSMHQHLVAAAVWRYMHKGESAALLQRIAKEQLVLVSTGASDWLDSSGELTKTEGGYLLNAKKPFASQSVAGDLVISSSRFLDASNNWQVLHFAVPVKSPGVSVLDDWKVLGMRASGSQTIVFDQVFIPESSITLSRGEKLYHPVWDIVLTVAMPLIMSVYVGIAEKSMELSIAMLRKSEGRKQNIATAIGQMNNTLLSAQVQWQAMILRCNDIDFKPYEALTIDILSLTKLVYKRLSRQCQLLADKAFIEKIYLNVCFVMYRQLNSIHYLSGNNMHLPENVC